MHVFVYMCVARPVPWHTRGRTVCGVPSLLQLCGSLWWQVPLHVGPSCFLTWTVTGGIFLDRWYLDLETENWRCFTPNRCTDVSFSALPGTTRRAIPILIQNRQQCVRARGRESVVRGRWWESEHCRKQVEPKSLGGVSHLREDKEGLWFLL